MKLKLLVLLLLTFPLYSMNNSTTKGTEQNLTKERLVATMLSFKRMESRLNAGKSDTKVIPLAFIIKMYAYNILLVCAQAEKDPGKMRRDMYWCASMFRKNTEIIPLLKYMVESYKEQELVSIEAMINAIGLGMHYPGQVNEYLPDGGTLLHAMISFKRPSLHRVKRLLSWNADPDKIDFFYKETPLDRALHHYAESTNKPPVNIQHVTDAEHLRDIIALLTPVTNLSLRRKDKMLCVERMIQRVPSWMILNLLKYTPDSALIGSLANKSPLTLLLINEASSPYDTDIQNAVFSRIAHYCQNFQVPVRLPEFVNIAMEVS